MRTGRILRVVGSLLSVVVLAGVVTVVLATAASAVGVPGAYAGPVGIAVAVTVALAVADVFTPVGRAPQSSAIREVGADRLAVDLLLGAVTASFLTAAAIASGDAANVTPDTAQLLAVVLGVAGGYGSFMLRNREYYLAE